LVRNEPDSPFILFWTGWYRHRCQKEAEKVATKMTNALKKADKSDAPVDNQNNGFIGKTGRKCLQQKHMDWLKVFSRCARNVQVQLR
jgi:hypothetical protein